MIVYRLGKSPHHLDLSGRGAELYSGRWNSKGTALLYTSESRALAFAELAMRIPMGLIPRDYFLVIIEIPDSAPLKRIQAEALPADWRLNPHPFSTQEIGDAFVQHRKQLVLCVPSAVVPGDHNYLVNPAHELSASVTILDVEPFEFDSRFSTRGS